MSTFQDKNLAILKQQFATTNEETKLNEVIKEPQPLPDSLPKVIPFDPEMLPESIRDYVSDIADRQQCPIDFVAVTAICGLAVLLGRKALMCPKQHDDWTVTPNLWGANVGRPSTMKSPAMRAALEPLKRIDANAADQYEIAKGEYELNKEFAALNKTTAKDKARKQMEEGKNEEAKATLQAATFNEAPPTRKRLIINDASVEKLGELLNQNPNGLILVRDELAGWLAKLAQEDYQMDRAFYLECFDGNGCYIYDRIGRGTIDIKNTTLSVIGGIQPSRISPLIRDAIRGTADDGLMQRLQLAVWPDDNNSWKWIDRAPNEKARKSYQTAFDRLYELNFTTKDGEPPYFHFTEKAQELFQQWMNEIQVGARAEDTHPALESYLLKMPQTVASLALLFQILDSIQPANKDGSPVLTIDAEKSTLLVDELATSQALDWADYLKSHAERLYSLATTKGIAGAHLILKRIDKLEDIFTARNILRKCWTGLTETRDVEDALICLVDYNHLTSREILPTTEGGRGTVIYIKNKKYTNKSKK